MTPASLPHMSFFLERVIKIDNLIPGISAYLEILREKLSQVEVYENPMEYVEMIDYQEKISNFLDILIDERDRTKKAKNQSSSNARANENGKKKR